MSVEALRIFEDTTTVGVQLVVNGVAIDTGEFGGEPEDNCESRDYSWVVPMLESAIDAATTAERTRCADICDEVRQIALRQTVGDMVHANGIAVGAGDCARRIRGEE